MGPAAAEVELVVCGLVQWQSLCIYLSGRDFFFHAPPTHYYCKYKANIHRLTTSFISNKYFCTLFPPRVISCSRLNLLQAEGPHLFSLDHSE